jgi:hypothetical protein
MLLNEEEKEKHRNEFSWGKVLLVAGLGFAALMIWILADFGPNAESITNVVATVNADASNECPETLAILATTSRPCAVTIRNKEGRSLTGVTLNVNGEYTFNVGRLEIGSYEAYSVDLADFAKRDGTRFNIVSTRILSMSLRSDQGSAYWTFEEE